ncbi:MAG: Flp pilus assembly complex ATPase component TadA [Deltaproteobacteria bacterium]|nr:Flp pilus assembly complex ATPase component TadA [Deltaproteobacteria bacterium]
MPLRSTRAANAPAITPGKAARRPTVEPSESAASTPTPRRIDPYARLRATDYDLAFVLDRLVEAKLVSSELAVQLVSRESVTRAQLVRERYGRQRAGSRRLDISPIEVAAAFKLPRPGREGELLDEDQITQTVAGAVGLPYFKIDVLKLDTPLITRTLSRPFARKHAVLTLGRDANALRVAVVNPFDRTLFETLQTLVGIEVRPHLASPSDIHRAITEIYGFRLSVRDASNRLRTSETDVKNLEQFVNLTAVGNLEATSEPVVAAVEYLLHYAIEQRASDIHIEPRREEAFVRMRIDGVLHAIYQVPKVVYAAIANRFKILSRLDITSRRPQDGRMRTARGDAEMEIRVSTVPTAFGDKLVLRILDPSMLVRDLNELGMAADERDQIERWLERPYGLIIVTGPTGSGKTTTLYAVLQHLATPEVNITTIEDPIELVHEGLNQIQADSKTGTGFADALRHVLRQDPDIVMVGEVRDSDTAMQAAQAALTGHLVFTTLHTNDTVSAISRLRHLGVPDYLIAATLTGVLAQRLVRRVCPNCAEDVQLTADELLEVGVRHPEDHVGRVLARRGVGCARCRYTGYYGRVGVFELLSVQRRLRQLVADGASPEAILRTARQDGLRTLREQGVRKIASGVTTCEEILSEILSSEAELR